MRKLLFFGRSSKRSYVSMHVAMGTARVASCLLLLSCLGVPLSSVLLSSVVGSGAEYAYAAEEEEEEREPQLGILSGERRGGSEGLSVGAAGDVKDAFTDEQAPVTGSVSQYSEKLHARVQNNSEENRYSLSFRVIELDKNDKKLRSSYFSAILGPGEKWEREMRKQARTAQALLELTRAKNLTPKKKKVDSDS